MDMNIIVLDGYTLNPGDLSWDGLKALGETIIYDRTPNEKIIERIGNAEIIFTNKTPITKDTILACPSLKFIGVMATGYNIIDVEVAKKAGIVVCNVPSYSTETVAQFTIGLLLELCHHIGDHSNSVKNKVWSQNIDFCYWEHPLIELSGKTMGIIGFGRIGQATAKIALALGMKILAYAVHPKNELEAENCSYTDLNTLYAESDVISLHCPLVPETKGLINKDSIAKMKDGVILLNTSRGPLIIEEDLRAALNNGKISGAAVDVVSSEPISKDNLLLDARNIIITPHIAWAAKEARERLMHTSIENLKSFQSGAPVNVVS
jgi:glycerate dehydrogenase